MPAGEQALYAAGSDGVIYEVGLLGAGSSNGLGSSSSGLQLAPHRRLEGHSRAVNSLAVSMDGEVLVSGSEDGTARVWDLRSGQPVQVCVRAWARGMLLYIGGSTGCCMYA